MTTIRRKWLRVLLIVGLVAIIVTTFIFGFFMRRFFIDFTEANYLNQVNNVKNQARLIFEEDQINRNQLSLTLEDYLDEPISNISIHNPDGEVIISVGKNMNMMMAHMQRMGGDVDVFEIKDNGKLLGILRIERSSTVQNSLITRQFTRTLIFNSIISGLSVLILIVTASFYISKEMSRELVKTAENAKNADSKLITNKNLSKIKEIFDIQSSLSQLSKKIKLKEKLRKEVVDSIVHQTQTPLTVLRSNLEGLLDEIIAPDKKRFEILMNQVNQLIILLDNLDERILTLGESVTVEMRETDFYEIIEKLVKGLELKFEKKGLGLNYEYSGEEIIITDESLLVQIIYNLINNAYKYTDQGEVNLKVIITEKEIEIKVQDTGKGIHRKDFDRVFEAYYRIDTEVGEGQGLGLYIVKNNVEALNGMIQVESVLKEGTTVTIRLPREEKI